MKVAVVIPAYNEEARIGGVLHAVTTSAVDEVVVVSDGSKDKTVEVARSFPGVKVIELPINMGKGAAMCAGVLNSTADIIVFIDADLVGLRASHVEQIVRPVIDGVDMCIGVFRRGKLWSDAAQVISPYISGQRAVRRQLIEMIPWLPEVRMGVEVTLNHVARKRHMIIRRVVIDGVTHTAKERKFGFVQGTAHRAKMYAEIGKAMVRSRKYTSRRYLG
ncbi:MAG: glycosyltransferase family 2 protein [Fimbriimonadales bacterium]